MVLTGKSQNDTRIGDSRAQGFKTIRVRNRVISRQFASLLVSSGLILAFTVGLIGKLKFI